VTFSKAANHLAHRKRQLVRDELTEAALKLLAFQGFERTTIDQIAAAAGVSRRTFFRYFQSKEDVIVESLRHMGEQLRSALDARPAEEPPATAVRQAFSVFVEELCAEYPEKELRLTRLILHTPALAARYLERQAEWKADVSASLARRAGVAAHDLRPTVIAGVAFAALEAALNAWVEGNGERHLGALLDETFALAFPASS
jgi:AcrR family transcriptional regulator